MFSKIIRLDRAHKLVNKTIVRFRNHERKSEVIHDNVATDYGEDCDLCGKVSELGERDDERTM